MSGVYTISGIVVGEISRVGLGNLRVGMWGKGQEAFNFLIDH